MIHLPLFEPRDGRLAVRRPTKGFKELAEKTGGKYFLVGDEKSALLPKQNDLTPIFQAIEEDLKSQYLLGFYISESARDNRKTRVFIDPETRRYRILCGPLRLFTHAKVLYHIKPPDSPKHA